MRKDILPVLLILLSFVGAKAQISPSEMVQQMGRGINLGNTLNAPIEGNWAPAVQESYFIDVAEAGFKTVRIPIRFDTYTTPLEDVDYTNNLGQYIGSPGDYQVAGNYLNRLEEVVGWALEHNLIAIIDVHGDHWFWESYDPDSEYYKTGSERRAAEDRFRAIWMAISDRFKEYPHTLLFEIMNEPYFAMNAPEVHMVNMDILSIIRQTNPYRNVIVTGGGQNSWEAPFTIKDELLQSDDHLIATFHYYLPRNFTVSSREGFNDFDWGNEEDKAEVDFHFDAVKSWSEEKGVPILFGEFGADNTEGYNYAKDSYSPYGGPEKESREAYHRYLADAGIDRGFALTVWDAGEKSNKTIYLASTRSWVEGVKNSVLGIMTNHSEIKKKCEILRIYPNPVQDHLYWEFEGELEDLAVVDALGKTQAVRYEKGHNISVKGWRPGIYYLLTHVEDGRKFVKAFVKVK